MEYYNLNELGTQLEEGDLILECTTTIRVDISIERMHTYIKNETGGTKLVLGKGWLVSLGLPTGDALASDTRPFLDGESQMVCDLKYLGEEGNAVRLEDAMRALGIDADVKIWRVKQAP